MTETKKTVEQLKAEYAALATEAREIDERLAELQPALAEHERLEARLSQITGPGRNLITNARIALKEALFEREMGGTDKPVIAEPDPMSLVGVSECHTVRVTTTGPFILRGCGGGGGSSSSPPATTVVAGGNGGCFDIGEWLPRTRPEPADGSRLTGPKLVIDETGKGYWR